MTVEAIDLTLEPMLAEARALVPVLRDRAKDTDERRRLSEQTVADIERLGMLHVGTPVAFGGADLGPDAILSLAFELARGCGSTGWVAGNWAIHNLFVAAFPEEAQKECFSEGRMPRIATALSPLRAKATPAPGGAVLDGVWDFASGVDHSDWVAVGAVGEQGHTVFLVPRSDLQIVETWHTSGLRGTGSNDVAANSLFVPEHRAVAMTDFSEGSTPGCDLHDTPFLRMPLGSWFGAGVIGAVLGIAAGAHDEFVRRTAEKLGGLTGVKVGDRTDVHLRMGLAETNIEAAVLMVRTMYADIRRSAEAGADYGYADRVRWRSAQAWAAKLATESMALLYKAGGAHVVYLDDALNRANRDMATGAQHYALQWDGTFIDRGRFSLDMDLLQYY